MLAALIIFQQSLLMLKKAKSLTNDFVNYNNQNTQKNY